MFVVNARITIDPSYRDEFESLARALWAETHRLEPGCRRYEYARLATIGRYAASMVFDDHAAFITHQASDHHVELAGRMREMIVDLQLDFAVALDGAWGVPADRATEPLDVAPATRQRYTERYPAPDFTGWDAQQ